VFNDAIEFNSDVSSWDIANIVLINDMFHGAAQFDRRMCDWDLSGVAGEKTNLFTGSQCTESLCVNCNDD